MNILSRKCFFIIILIAGLLPYVASAQKLDTISTFSITGYLDAYYAYYTDSVGPGNNQKFPSTSPKSNTPSLNTAQIAVQYTADKVRGMAVFHYGDIAAATWAPAPYSNLMEAHVGFKVYSKLWVDAGFFRTHFGTEYLLPVENITSSVAVATFYEPYYESGLRLNFDPTKKLEINLFLLNGYGVFVDNNNKKSLGGGITYSLGDNSGIGYTNYTGDDSPEGSPQSHLRILHNLFFNYQVKKIKIQVGADYGTQQNSDIKTGKNTASMFSGMATVRYQCGKKAAVYARGEVFNDPDGFMSTVITDNAGHKTGYKLYGATAGFEYKPTAESYIRLENRLLQMDKDQYIFLSNGIHQNSRYEVMVNAGVSFDVLKNVLTKKAD